MVQAGTDGVQVFNAQSDGVILYSTDGYENLTVSDVTADMLSKKNYNSVNKKNNSKVNSGEAIYKLVKDDDWSLVIPLDDKTAKNLADTKSVKVQFTKDQVKERASFSSIQCQKHKPWYPYISYFHGPLCERPLSGY